MRLLKTKSLGATIVVSALCPVVDLHAIATATQVSVFRNRTDACLATVQAQDTVALSWAPAGRLLAICSKQGDVRILHVDNGDVVRQFSTSRSKPPNTAASRASASAPAAAGPTAPASHRLSLAGSVVDACWITVPLGGSPLASVARRSLAVPSLPPPQPGQPPSAGALRLALVHHARHWWEAGTAALLAVADDQGSVSLILDGLAEVWTLRLPSLAGRLRQLCPTDTLDLGFLVAPPRAGSTVTDEPNAVAQASLSFVNLAPIALHCTLASRLQSILVVEYAALASQSLGAANTAWYQSLRRLLEKACGGAAGIAEVRASILGFMFAPAPGRPLMPLGSQQPSRASSATPNTSAARVRTATPQPQLGRSPSPGNRGAGRGPARDEAEAPPRLEFAELTTLLEQLQTAYAEGAAGAIDLGQRAVGIALEYTAGIITPAALTKMLAGNSAAAAAADESRSSSSSRAMSNVRKSLSREPSPRQSLAAVSAAAAVQRGSSVQSGSGAAAAGFLPLDDGNLSSTLHALSSATAAWFQKVSTQRAHASALLHFVSRGSDGGPWNLSVADFAGIFGLLTSMMPHCDDELAILCDVFGDDQIPGDVSAPVVTDFTRVAEAAVARCNDVLQRIDAVCNEHMPVYANDGQPLLKDGFTVAETLELMRVMPDGAAPPALAAFSIASALRPKPTTEPDASSIGGRSAKTPLGPSAWCAGTTAAAVGTTTPGKMLFTVVAKEDLACTSSTLAMRHKLGYCDALHPFRFNPDSNDVAAVLADRADRYRCVAVRGLADAAEGPAALVATVDKSASGQEAASIVVWRMVAADDDDSDEDIPASRMKLVVAGLGMGATTAGGPPVVIDTAEHRGFALVAAGQRYALIDLDDDEDENDADDNA